MASQRPTFIPLEVGFMTLTQAAGFYFRSRFTGVCRGPAIAKRLEEGRKAMRAARYVFRKAGLVDASGAVPILHGVVIWGPWLERCAAKIAQAARRGDLPLHMQPLGEGGDGCPVRLGGPVRLTREVMDAWPRRLTRGSPGPIGYRTVVDFPMRWGELRKLVGAQLSGLGQACTSVALVVDVVQFAEWLGKRKRLERWPSSSVGKEGGRPKTRLQRATGKKGGRRTPPELTDFVQQLIFTGAWIRDVHSAEQLRRQVVRKGSGLPARSPKQLLRIADQIISAAKTD